MPRWGGEREREEFEDAMLLPLKTGARGQGGEGVRG